MTERRDKPPAFGDADKIKEFPKCKGVMKGDPRFKEHDLVEIASGPSSDPQGGFKGGRGPRMYECCICGDQFPEGQVPRSYWRDED